MPEPIYFQWQNDFLLKTIYPLREMKLRDFLVYYYEIDVWAEYKHKTEADIKPEAQAYQETQKRLWAEAYEKYDTCWKYFTKDDVTEEYSDERKYPLLDKGFMDKINAMHKLFAKYFPNYQNPNKERYFLAARVSEFEQLRKDLERQLANKQRIVRNMGPNWKNTPAYKAEINMLENVTLKMADEELSRLYEFLAAFSRLEKRRAELHAWKRRQKKVSAELETRLNRAKTEAGRVENQFNQAASAARKLRNPPSYEDMKAYFLKPDVSEIYQNEFKDHDSNMLRLINLAHNEFKRFPANKNLQKQFVDRLIATYKPRWLTFGGVAKQMAQVELGKLQDFADAIDVDTKSPEKITSELNKVETSRQEFEGQLRAKQAEVNGLEEQFKSVLNAVNLPEREQLAVYTSAQSVTVRDVVRGKVEAYQNQLAQQDHRQLLEEVVRRFQSDPRRYPAWLQYMVIHFSGMRYQSAHGSWADPRDLLEALIEKAVEREINKASDFAIEALCQEKIEIYERAKTIQGNQGRLAEDEGELPGLARSQKPYWTAKVKRHLETLKSFNLRVKVTPAEGKPAASLYQEQLGGTLVASSADTLPKDSEVTVDLSSVTQESEYYRVLEHPANPQAVGLYLSLEDLTVIPDPRKRKRKALVDLRIDEETYAIEEELSDRQVLEQLEDLKDRLGLPGWMWNEIVRLTDLRLKEVKSANWESLTPQEMADRQAHEWREYRQLMDQWKKANLTGWREEHDRANRLVVTRAVCNEVAEHIQHLRGHSPPGGLTAKPGWYLRKEKDPKLVQGADRPFFVKPSSAADFKPGASILWLRYVDSQPNAWQIANPITLKDNSGLLPASLRVIKGEVQAALGQVSAAPKPNTASPWAYHQDSGGRFKRSRHAFDQKNARRAETQWLRWMHEATVVEVAETADGTVVLTFETALPYEDRRRSTIGVFKHYLGDLLHNISANTFRGTFVGYIPEGALPRADLDELLDWDKVLGKSAAPKQAAAPAPQVLPGVPMEAVPPLRPANQQEWIICYEVDPVKRAAKPYSPSAEVELHVELPRGTRLRVAKDRAETVGAERYYPVSLCEADPRAQDLYVRATEVVDAPEGGADKPAAAKSQVTLKTIARAGQGGLPVMVEAKHRETGQAIQLAPGTKLRVSTVHKVAGAEGGDGRLKADTGQSFALIIECPSRSSATGFFAPSADLQEIGEEEYTQGATQSRPQHRLKAKVVPPAGQTSISLLKKTAAGTSEVSAGNILAQDVEIILDARLEFETGKEYYRILEYPANPGLVGMYVNAREVAAVIEAASQEAVKVP